MTGPIIDKRCEIMSNTSDEARVTPLGCKKGVVRERRGKGCGQDEECQKGVEPGGQLWR